MIILLLFLVFFKALVSPLLMISESEDLLIGLLLDVLILIVSSIIIFSRLMFLGRWRQWVYFFVALVLVLVPVQLLIEVDFVGFIKYIARFFIPMLVGVALLIFLDFPKKEISTEIRLVPWLMSSLVVMSILGLLFMPEMYNHFEVKWPTYFSGLHKSSYILGLVFVFSAITVLREKEYRIYWCLLSLVSIVFIFYGWGIRTPVVFIVSMFLMIQLLDKRFRRYLPLVISGVFVFMALTFTYMWYLNFDFNRFSSGRLSMWGLKFTMFWEAGGLQKLFGSGYGSDFVMVEGWFGEKDSHNTYIQLVVEYGVVGFILFALLIFSIIKNSYGVVSKGLWIGYISTGLVSNGLIFRPLPSYIFMVVLFYFSYFEKYGSEVKVLNTNDYT